MTYAAWFADDFRSANLVTVRLSQLLLRFLWEGSREDQKICGKTNDEENMKGVKIEAKGRCAKIQALSPSFRGNSCLGEMLECWRSIYHDKVFSHSDETRGDDEIELILFRKLVKAIENLDEDDLMRLLPTNFFAECLSTMYNGVNYHDYMQWQYRSRKRARQWKVQHQEIPLDGTRRREDYTYKLFAVAWDELGFISSSAEYGDYIVRFDGCDVALVVRPLCEGWEPSYAYPGLGDCAVVGRAFFLKLGGRERTDKERPGQSSRFEYGFYAEERYRWFMHWDSLHCVNLFPGEWMRLTW